MFCLSNRDGTTAPTALLKEFADAIAHAFEVSPAQVGLNDPFKGGYITQRHGGGRVPWIQVEMNRCLYLDERWFDRDALRIDTRRIADLRDRFREALRRLKS